MNHRISQKKLNRTSEHRLAMRRNLAQSLIQHGEIRTTLAKAKDLQPFAERLITLAKRARRGDLNARRCLDSLMTDRSFIPAEHQEAYDMLSDAKRQQVLKMRSGRRHRTGAAKGKLDFTAESIVHRLIDGVASNFQNRDGGYTRLVKLADRRLGDKTPLAIVQLVGNETSPGSVTRPGKTSRRRRADVRYAFAARVAKQFGRSQPVTSRTQESASQGAEAEPS